VSHTKYWPQKGDADRNRYLLYSRRMRWEKGKRTGHDSEIRGPFPATNNNARLVFFLSYMRISIYIEYMY